MYPEVDPAVSSKHRYHVVPFWRFYVFSVLTFNMYTIYWFYKNWQQIKNADGSDIWPIPRALFAGFTYFSLLTDINTQLALRDRNADTLSAAYGVGFLLSNLITRLPDPYWLISVPLAPMCIYPAVEAIGSLASDTETSDGAAWRLRHTNLTLVSIPLFLLSVYGTFFPE